MESQPQNPEFRINPEDFHPCIFRQEAMQSWTQTLMGSTPKQYVPVRAT